jgi:hypothetical protein
MDSDVYRIIVTGARAYPDGLISWVEGIITEAWGHRPAYNQQVLFKHGACPVGDGGIDGITDRFIKRYWRSSEERAFGAEPLVDVQPWPADFAGRGGKAGPERNTHMVRDGADQCIAFPGPNSTGTWDCVFKAVAAGIPTTAWLLPGQWLPNWMSLALPFEGITAPLHLLPVPSVVNE